MSLPFRSLFVAIAVTVLPTLFDRAHATERPAVAGATYYGDPSRRPLDGSRRGGGWREPSAASAKDDVPPPIDRGWRQPQMPAAPIWGGFYMGVHAGGGRGSIDTGLGDVDGSGALVGLHIGYLARFGALAAGLEIDADWTAIDDHQSLGPAAAFATSLDWLSSARLLVGVDAGPALLYATAGTALAHLDLSASGPGFSLSATETSGGFVVGGGVQFAINDRLALRVEGLHYMFSEESIVTPAGTFRPESDVTTLRAGISIRFN